MLAHLDLDAFFAAVELHRRPELRGRPMVVGGDPDGRGVVATASYAAREYGIRSAMSCAEARRRCPSVVFVRPDIDHYREWSRRVWELVARLSPCVEQIGLDEGYLLLDEPAPQHARAIQTAIRREIRLSCSLGVATCKVVAKIASDRRKPGGVTVVPPGGEAAFLFPLPARALPGVGPRTGERLAAARILTVGDVARLTDGQLAELLPGAPGAEIRDRARGNDPRPVLSQPPGRVSLSLERTFDRDVADAGALTATLREWAAMLAGHLEGDGQGARTVTVKLRYPDFRTVTRSRTLPAPTRDAATIAATGEDLLAGALRERLAPVRLLGLGVSGLAPHAQLALFASTAG